MNVFDQKPVPANIQEQVNTLNSKISNFSSNVCTNITDIRNAVPNNKDQAVISGSSTFSNLFGLTGVTYGIARNANGRIDGFLAKGNGYISTFYIQTDNSIDYSIINETTRHMPTISASTLDDLKDAITALKTTMSDTESIDVVFATTSAFGIFMVGTHSMTFHKINSNYYWGYGFMNNNMFTMSCAAGTWTFKKYSPDA